MRKLSLLLFAALIMSCANNTKSPETTENTKSKPTQETSTPKDEPKFLIAGDELTLPSNKGGEVKLLFKEVNPVKLPNGTYNLVLKVQIKNNLTQKFLISDVSWKLTDSDMIEIEESGIYNFDYNDFAPGTFFFTIVESGFGKIQEVGYHVNKGTYYLHIANMNVARILVQD